MKICTFLGHRDAAGDIAPVLEKTIEKLIVEQDVTLFYVGDCGNFDSFALHALRKIKGIYPHIVYVVVLAYMPGEQEAHRYRLGETLIPEGIETVPKRFAISFRNLWMIRRADYVIAYQIRSYGGAAQFCQKAIRYGKKVINIAEKFEKSKPPVH